MKIFVLQIILLYIVSYRHTYLVFDFLPPLSIPEGVARLLKHCGGWTDMCYHHGDAVAPQSVLEQPGEFGVTVVDKVCVVRHESIHTVSQREERPVDVTALDHALATILKQRSK